MGLSQTQTFVQQRWHPSLLPATLIVAMTKNNLEEKRFVRISQPHHNPFQREVRAGTWSQELMQGLWRRAAYWLSQPAFLQHLGPATQIQHHHNELDSPFLVSIIIIKKQTQPHVHRPISYRLPHTHIEDRASLCSPGCPETHTVAQAGLELTDIHLPLPPKCWV